MRYGLEQSNITQTYYGESSRGNKRTHIRFASKHLRNSSLYDAGSTLALLARQRSSDSKADSRPRLDELLPAKVVRTRALHTLREHLVYDTPKCALLARDIERRCLARSRCRWVRGLQGRSRRWRRRTQVNMDDRRGRL
jgi:hypothetical protein